MEKLLQRFDFNIEELSQDAQISVRKEIKYLQRKFKKLFSNETFDEILNTLSGLGEYKDFLDTMEDFFVDMTRLQIILKTQPNPKTFGSLVMFDYLFSKDCFEIYHSLLFQNVNKLFMVFATLKPKRINQIFIAFCKVFTDDKDFVTHALVSSLLQHTHVCLQTQYSEYQLSELFKKEFSLMEENATK